MKILDFIGSWSVFGDDRAIQQPILEEGRVKFVASPERFLIY
ncbi:MAG: hypothetical protein O9270_03680 [Aquidulcibacter sp.]|nr:hypothetical protein [Aquidulcibacter sp.]MCZ8207274.1 hypothetical protein [Aquidulcibacter sp.]